RNASEVAFLFLALHCAETVVIDKTSLPLGIARVESFSENGFDILRIGQRRRCNRPASKRAKANFPQFRRFAGLERNPVVVNDENLLVPDDCRTLFREIERNDL